MGDERYTYSYGDPFRGNMRIRLEGFLAAQGLTYDEGITHTMIIEADGRIIASGSCQDNIIKCVAVDPDFQGQDLMASVMTHLISYLMNRGITHYFGFTKPANKAIFCSMGLYPVAETGQVLLLENRRDGLQRYLEKLQQETVQWESRHPSASWVDDAGRMPVGAIVANCNPFTLGHRYLITHAASECSSVHLFILSESKGMFTAGERMAMVREGTADLSNVIVHSTSDYLISPAVFPTYFIKDKARAYEINCMLDIHIFGSRIARALGITRRIVGSEPSCQVTAMYNTCLQEKLPAYGIEVECVERLQANEQTVSASAVREALAKGQLSEVRHMLPDTTWRYIRQRTR